MKNTMTKVFVLLILVLIMYCTTACTYVLPDSFVEVDVEDNYIGQPNFTEPTNSTTFSTSTMEPTVSDEESTTTELTMETTTEPIVETTTEPIMETTTETMTEDVHYWEYSYYIEYEDVVYYKCNISDCMATKSEKVSNIDILLLTTETGVQLIVYGGLFPCAELYCTYDDFRTEEVALIDTLGVVDEYCGYANIDLNQISWLTVKAFDATSRRMLIVDYAIVNGNIIN
jgi:hypothetical protein